MQAVGTPKSVETAAIWFLKAANSGHDKSQYNVGVMYEMGQGLEKRLDLARHYFQLSADQGYSQAAEALKNLESQQQ